jgi:hypothetical protein
MIIGIRLKYQSNVEIQNKKKSNFERSYLIMKKILNKNVKTFEAQFLVNKTLKDELKTKYNLKKVLKKTPLDSIGSAYKIRDLVVILDNLIKRKLNKTMKLNYQTI